MIKQPEQNQNKVAIDIVSRLYFDLLATDSSLPTDWIFDTSIRLAMSFCDQLMNVYELIDTSNPKADYFAADMFLFYRQVKKIIPQIKFNQLKIPE